MNARKLSNNEMKRRADARDNPKASIEDTARLMPEFLEAKFAKSEKYHKLVITNGRRASWYRIKKVDPALSSQTRS